MALQPKEGIFNSNLIQLSNRRHTLLQDCLTILTVLCHYATQDFPLNVDINHTKTKSKAWFFMDSLVD